MELPEPPKGGVQMAGIYLENIEATLLSGIIIISGESVRVEIIE